MALIVTAADVRRLMSLSDCIAAVEEAFRAHGEGRVEAGVLSAHGAGGVFHIKTAAIGRRFGAKANANFPSNPARRGLPAIQGLMLLFDSGDGRPLAVLDSIELTAMRTAAATAVAAKYLAPQNATTVAIAGCGKQGRAQLEAIARVLPVKRALAFDVDCDRALQYAAEMSGRLRVPVTARESLEGIDAGVWITCTPSPTPFLHRSHVKPGAFVAAVGADNSSKSEIAPELMAGSRVVTDVTDQCIEMGDLHHAIAAGAMTRDDVVAQLGEVIATNRNVRTTEADIVVFDSTGAGFEDAAAAALIYERAREAGCLDVQFGAT
ncbi:MAG TPA: ornithine cyclodeaminase family protein [Thermoanaerobaculia bacterium]